MSDTPPEFAEDVRPCAGEAGRREAGGKELARQNGPEVYSRAQVAILPA